MFKSTLKAGALAAPDRRDGGGRGARRRLPQTITVDGEKVFPESMTSRCGWLACSSAASATR